MSVVSTTIIRLTLFKDLVQLRLFEHIPSQFAMKEKDSQLVLTDNLEVYAYLMKGMSAVRKNERTSYDKEVKKRKSNVVDTNTRLQ